MPWRQRRPHAAAAQHDTAHAVVGEEPGARRQASGGVNHHANRLRARNAPNGQLRIVRERRPDPDDHCIDQGAQPVQMRQPSRSVDVVRMSSRGGDAAVERLAELADDHHVVGLSRAQRPEHCFPGGW